RSSDLYARSQQLDFVAVTEAEEVATNGVAATTGAGDELRVGKSAFIAEVVPEFSELELHAGETAVYVSRAHQLIGIIILADPLRATSKATLEWLSEHGVEDMVRVTGDMKGTAQAIAKELDFAPDQVYASMTPSDKVKSFSNCQLRHSWLVTASMTRQFWRQLTSALPWVPGAPQQHQNQPTPSSLPKISLGWPTLCIFRNARLISQCSPSGLV